MHLNRNLTKLDMLTSSSSNMTDQTLLLNEHLKKYPTKCLYLHFANSNCIVIFSHFILNITKNCFISGIYTKFICLIFFLYILNCHKSGKNIYSFLVLLSMEPTWHYKFLLFHSHNPPQKIYHQMANSRAKTRSTQSQTCIKYEVINICIRRN